MLPSDFCALKTEIAQFSIGYYLNTNPELISIKKIQTEILPEIVELQSKRTLLLPLN